MRIRVRFIALLALWLGAVTTAPAFADDQEYVFGRVPSQMVVVDPSNPAKYRPLAFRVVPSVPQAALSCSVPTPPAGAVTFDASAGYFKFVPGRGEISDFDVSLVQTLTDGTQEHQDITILISPVASTTEYQLVSSQGQPPLLEDNDYLTVSETANPAQDFNGVNRATRDVIISGKAVVIDMADVNGLRERLKGSDIRRLTVYAERLVIGAPLRLPQSDVVIYARELEFRDPSPSDGVASISTEPLDRAKAEQLRPGQVGYDGGSIMLYIGGITGGPAARARLITKGGKGQAAGEGKPGKQGDCLNPVDIGGGGPGGLSDEVIKGMVWVEEYHGADRFATRGTRSWPTDGYAGTPAPMPGDGGSAGNVVSSVPIEPVQLDMKGGMPGDRGAVVKGGPPGEPKHAYWVRKDWIPYQTDDPERHGTPPVHYFTHRASVISERIQSTGASASPLGPAKVGSDGTCRVIGNTAYTWLHPLVLKPILAYLEDTYMHGNYDEAARLLRSYIPIAEEYVANCKDPDLRMRAQEALLQMATLRHRLASNLDYFGNPAGWVPMLSFEANLRAYEDELDYAMRVMYLSEWLKRKTLTIEERKSALQGMLAQLDKEAGAVRQRYEEAQAAIPQIESESIAIAAQADQLQKELAQKEQELQKRAESNVDDARKAPLWKQGIRVISTVAKVVPVYQPALGAIGTGLGMLVGDNAEGPSMLGQPFESQLSQSKIIESEKSMNELFAQMDRDRSKDPTTCVQKLLDGEYQLKPAVDAIAEATQSCQVPRSDVDAELGRLKAADPVFEELATKAQSLLRRKQELNMRLKLLVQETMNLSNRLTADLIAQDDIHRSLNAVSSHLDHRAILQVRTMEREAEQRLIRYQYYLAKSYEYRVLKPYPIDYRLTDVVKKLIAMADAAERGPSISESEVGELRDIYEGQLRKVFEVGLEQLRKRAPDLSVSYPFSLSQEELRTLNTDREDRCGEVDIDLLSKVLPPAEQENRRIVDVKVESFEAKVEADGVVDSANVSLEIDHEDISIIRSGADLFFFNHESDGGYALFTWEANCDAISKQVISASTSDAWLSFTKALLGSDFNDKELLTFVRPAADGHLRIRRHDTTPDASVKFSKLILSVKVDFTRSRAGRALLNVRAQGAYPYIICSTEDLGHRKDGIGSFTRIYSAGDRVQLTAPTRSGNSRFVEWRDGAGHAVANPTLSLTLGTSQTARAVYRPLQ